MDGLVVVAVLIGALLHAGWNTLVKSSGDMQLDLALVHCLGALVAMPLLIAVGLPHPTIWPYVLASLGIHVAYYVTLNGAYQHGDLGLTYPVMRGSAPLLVAFGSSTLLGEPLSAGAWVGVMAVTGGVLLIGFTRTGYETKQRRRAIGYALANAAVIASYTFVDGRGVRANAALGGTVASYLVLLFVLDGVPYPAWVWWRRNTMGRRAILDYARSRWPLASLGGLASMASYGIALWAMTRAPVAVVSALRETSVLFAAVLSMLVLKEQPSVQRLVGAGVIVAGVAALRLS